MSTRPRPWWFRVAALAGAFALVAADRGAFPPGYEPWAWGLVAAFALETALTFPRRLRALDPLVAYVAVIAADTLLAFGAMLVFEFQRDQPLRALVFVLVAETALRFGSRGGLAMALIAGGLLAGAEAWSVDRFGEAFDEEAVLVRFAIALAVGFLVGRLTDSLVEQRGVAVSRAAEAERLRDALGRRVDVLEAANRCARALGSSLDVEEAFGAFLRELRGLMPFDRTGLVLLEEGDARVVAAAGRGAGEVFAPGSARPAAGSILDDVVRQGQTVYRPDMRDLRYPEEEDLVALGLRSRLVAPLLVGARAIGIISLVRRDENGFTDDEIELVSLLGRLAGTAVQNIRSYEAERETVEELRRLSALRADFVSLVSHELRSPMAAVIGAARTLQDRWRSLSAGQREAFLALIADETGRLAALIGDVLDTSRIEAGTFSYQFADVDVRALVEDVVTVAALGHEDVSVVPALPRRLPRVRGDHERLRQVVANLIDNAVKYSPEGGSVEVQAAARDGAVRISVSDLGPGIPYDQQRLIFEKFGRADVAGGGSKPGTGLGLFIARSIAEAHGGSLEVRSRPQAGATFTLTLPAAP